MAWPASSSSVAVVKFCARTGGRLLEVSVVRRDGRYVVEIDGQRHVVDAYELEGNFYSILNDGRSYEVSVQTERDGYRVRHGAAEQLVSLSDPGRRAREAGRLEDGPEEIVSLMPGKVVRVLVAEGDSVAAGQGLLVIEAMKMENEIVATRGGRVSSLRVEAGQVVQGGAVLAVIDAG